MSDQDKRLAVNLPLIGLMVAFPIFASLTYFMTVKQADASGCPIAIDLNGNKRIDIIGHTTAQEKHYTMFSIGQYVEFDIFDIGDPQPLDWIAPNTDALLVNIADWEQGTPFTGRHLFGTVGVSSAGEPENFENGFKKLVRWDLNSDGVISGDEADDLRLWVDNGDAVPQAQELFKFADKEIASISVAFNVVPGAYGADVIVSDATLTSGDTIYVEDIWFMTPGDVSDVHAQVRGYMENIGF